MHHGALHGPPRPPPRAPSPTHYSRARRARYRVKLESRLYPIYRGTQAHTDERSTSMLLMRLSTRRLGVTTHQRTTPRHTTSQCGIRMRLPQHAAEHALLHQGASTPSHAPSWSTGNHHTSQEASGRCVVCASRPTLPRALSPLRPPTALPGAAGRALARQLTPSSAESTPAVWPWACWCHRPEAPRAQPSAAAAPEAPTQRWASRPPARKTRLAAGWQTARSGRAAPRCAHTA